VFDRKCEFNCRYRKPNGITIVKLLVFPSAVKPGTSCDRTYRHTFPITLSSSKRLHCSKVPKPYCVLLMQTHQFKFTLINTLVLRSAKLLFEIVNFSIYQKSKCGGRVASHYCHHSKVCVFISIQVISEGRSGKPWEPSNKFMFLFFPNKNNPHLFLVFPFLLPFYCILHSSLQSAKSLWTLF
jgi:hypothetical protein